MLVNYLPVVQLEENVIKGKLIGKHDNFDQIYVVDTVE